MATLQARAFTWFVLLHSFNMLLQVRAGPRNVTIDDTDSAFNYTSSPAWDTIVWDQQSPQPLNGTNHGSTNPGAEVTFTFTGTAFYMFGYKWTDHGFRTITVDGTRTIQCDGRQGEQGSRSLIFSRENMTNSQHTVVIENTGTLGQYINIDYALVTQDDTVLTSTTTSASQPTTSVITTPATNKPFPIAVVAGAAAGGIVFALLILGMFILWRCKLSRRYPMRSRVVSPPSWKATAAPLSLNSIPYASPSAAVTPSSYSPMSSSVPFQQSPRPQYSSLNNVPSTGSLGSSHTSTPLASPRSPTQFPVRHVYSVPTLATSSVQQIPTGPSLVQLGYTPLQHNQYIHHQSEKERQFSSAANRRSGADPSRIAGGHRRRSTLDAPPQYTVTP